MWEEIGAMALNYGLIPALFVTLLIYVLKDTKERETKYQDMLDKMHDALKIVDEIEKNIKGIGDTLLQLTKDVAKITPQ